MTTTAEALDALKARFGALADLVRAARRARQHDLVRAQVGRRLQPQPARAHPAELEEYLTEAEHQ